MQYHLFRLTQLPFFVCFKQFKHTTKTVTNEISVIQDNNDRVVERLNKNYEETYNRQAIKYISFSARMKSNFFGENINVGTQNRCT